TPRPPRLRGRSGLADLRPRRRVVSLAGRCARPFQHRDAFAGSARENIAVRREAPDGHTFRSLRMKIYVGNMSFKTTEASLEGLFSNYGQVDEVAVVTDRETGRPRGFAFVTMGNDDEARAAIEALNGQEFEGRTLTVNEA